MWSALPTGVQDLAILLALVAPVGVMAVLLTRGYAPWPLVWTMLRRFRVPSGLFVALIAVSVAISVGLLAQERGLRQGSAAVTDKFDLIVTRPGSDVSALVNTVFLQPAAVPLIDGGTYDAIATAPRIATAAPLAFGDSFKGAPVVGTTADFARHLAQDRITGRNFERYFEAVVGADVPLRIGDSFEPAHGLGDEAEEGVHDAAIGVVGTLPHTGSPWDNAILVAIETVWDTHGLANGHDPATLPEGMQEEERIGPPFDPAFFPGTPAVLITGENPAALYRLRQQFDAELDLMAFFPGAVLSRLHGLLGDVRSAMSLLALVSQGLVAVSILVGLALLVRLFARQIALLRATGAPTRFLLAVVWGFATTLLCLGSLMGMALGVGAAQLLAAIVSARTQVDVSATLGWPELHLVAAFVTLSSLLALIPAVLTARQPVIAALRS